VVVKLPEVALKEPVRAPVGTVSDPTTGKLPLLLVRVIMAPLAGAGLLSVTVQLVDVRGPTLAGEH
jgi:hypothetical protein